MAGLVKSSEQVVWSPYEPPSHPDKSNPPPHYEHIHIKHPGYDDASNTLFTLPPLDASGLCHEILCDACSIIVGNKKGFFTLDKQGTQAVPKAEKILKARTYYYHIAGDVEYEVIPTFEHWQFPWSDVFPRWLEVPSFDQTSRPSSDDYCRITQYEDGVEDAHLVPAAQRRWFNNNMASYVDSTRVDKLKDPDNSIRLRSDIHTIFDAKRFAIVPIDERLVVYCFNARLGSQAERLYHGVELHRVHDSGCLGQFLLARFAYTVFERLRGFLEADVPRKLRLRIDNETKVEKCNAERCWRFAKDTAYQGKSRSVSPRKRPPPDVEEQNDSEDDWSDSDSRGRKRLRSSESSSFSSSISSVLIDSSHDPSAARSGSLPLPSWRSKTTSGSDLTPLGEAKHPSSTGSCPPGT